MKEEGCAGTHLTVRYFIVKPSGVSLEVPPNRAKGMYVPVQLLAFRDSRFERLLAWARKVSAKTGIPLEGL
jgi:hypothetical protein